MDPGDTVLGREVAPAHTPSPKWVHLVKWLVREKSETLSSGEEDSSGFSRVEKLSQVDCANAGHAEQ